VNGNGTILECGGVAAAFLQAIRRELFAIRDEFQIAFAEFAEILKRT
jgi:hypothetical protein